MRELGVDRVVLARENTLDDIRAIRAAVPDLGLETFVHGALCISYSGQCYMSGMISERSANRGSCAQSCRKDYVLTDAATGQELDRGFLISAKDLGALTITSRRSRRPASAASRSKGGRRSPSTSRRSRMAIASFSTAWSRAIRGAAVVRGRAAARPDLQPRLHAAACTAVERAATTSRARSPTITAS